MDGLRVARGDNLKTAIGRLHEAMVVLEEGRQRKRRASVVVAQKRLLEAIVCDLYHEARLGRGRWLSFSSGNRAGPLHDTRYATALDQHRAHFRPILAFLQVRGFVDYKPGYRKPDGRTGGAAWEAVSSKVRATEYLVNFLEVFGRATPAEIGDAPFETIRLRGAKPTRCQQGLLIEYVDDPETDAMRAEMERVNVAVAAAQATLILSSDSSAVRAIDDNASSPRQGERGYRVFNDGNFAMGGRMYGWWWQSLPKNQRHRLRICGQPVVEVDFQAIHLRLLYHQRGLSYPVEDDPFCPHRLGLPDVPRGDIKEEFLRVVNKPYENKRPSARQSRIVTALATHHRPIATAFHTGAGLALMRIDSDIAVGTVLALYAVGVPVLPMHDGFLAREIDAAAVDAAMVAAYRDVVGADAWPAIKVKGDQALAA